MFAGEGGPERTNKRFHYVSLGQPAHRLSTAFDSVTLYGEDPGIAPIFMARWVTAALVLPRLTMRKNYTAALICAAQNFGKHDYQWSCAQCYSHFHECCHRPAMRALIEANKQWPVVNEKITENSNICGSPFIIIQLRGKAAGR